LRWRCCAANSFSISVKRQLGWDESNMLFYQAKNVWWNFTNTSKRKYCNNKNTNHQEHSDNAGRT
jgi:hypothetical protein